MTEQLWDSHTCGNLLVLHPVKGAGVYAWCPVCGALFDRTDPVITKRVPEWSRRIAISDAVLPA